MKSLLAAFLSALFIGNAAADPFNAFENARIDPKPGAAIPLDRIFRDDHGTLRSLRSIGDGRPLLLAPVLHHCPNICDVTLGGLMSAIEAQSYLPGRDFEIIAFSIDPAETTQAAVESVAALRGRFPGLPSIHAVTGTSDDVAAVTAALGYRYAWDPAIDQYAHVAAVAVLTPDGRLARWLYGLAPQPDDVQSALSEAALGSTVSLGEQLLLLCYHYDAAAGHYAPLVWGLLRTAGVITVGAIGLFIVAAVRRERRTRRVGAS
jgi:protein SCO1/2